MNILVAIASYGTGNDRYLAEVIREYRSMPFAVDVVVFSNVVKEVGPGIELVVGLPTKNPRSLPFAHKHLFAQRQEQYDLFIYTEDDIPLTATNIQAFLLASEVLPKDEIAGFLRFEKGSTSEIRLVDALGPFHWDPTSVKLRGGRIFAHFTNEHAGLYILTREQLQRAIASGGFLLAPYAGAYHMLETAATDPYTRCGMKKMICISSLDDFLVPHLSNKYVGKFGVERSDFCKQIKALMNLQGEGKCGLFRTESRLPRMMYSKFFYETAKTDILSLVPENSSDILSIGCGSGELEAVLTAKGMRVTGLPLDPVIGACAEAKGVEIIGGDFETARRKLTNKRFDVILVPNVLHLVENPNQILSSFGNLLHKNSVVIVVVPNFLSLVAFRRIRSKGRYRDLASYEKSGVHFTSRRTIRRWLRNAGLRIERTKYVLSMGAHKVSQRTLGLFDFLLAEELIVLAKRV